MSSQQQSRDLLGMCLDEQGAHTEAQNVRAGVDLESYELELRLIGQLLRFGLNTPRGHELAALASQPQASHASGDALAASLAKRVYHAAHVAPCAGQAQAEWAIADLLRPHVAGQQAQAPAAVVPEEWRAFVESCAYMRGLSVDGNRLALKARELLAAAPAPEVAP